MENSDKAVVALLLAVVVVSLAGTLLTLNKISTISRLRIPITGMGSGSGDINVSISESTTITVTDGSIDFGTGTVTGAASWAQVWSNDSATTINGSWTSPNSGIVIRNDGNIPINLTVTSNRNSTDMLGTSNVTTPGFQFWFVDDYEGDACAQSGIENFTSTPTEFNTTEQVGCAEFPFDEDNDEIRMDITLVIPNDAQGNKSATLTFSSEKSPYAP